MVVIDTTMLLLFLRPGAGVPADARGRSVTHPKERIEFLIHKLSEARTKILIPTPALSELLVRAGTEDAQRLIDTIHRYSAFQIESFDTRAAIEVAIMTRAVLDRGGKKSRTAAATWAKLKYDWQIVSVAKVNQATEIYSDDSDIRSAARQAEIRVVGLADLQLPPEAAQLGMFDRAE